MTRYVIMKGRSCGKTTDVPRALDWYELPPQPLPHPTAFVSEPVRTGILDPDGNDIFRAPDPIGFLGR